MARRDDDYGKVLPTRRWRGQPQRRRRWWQSWKPWLLAALLIAALQVIDRWWVVAPAELQGTPQRITAAFRPCGVGRGPNCVVDGDTFIMGTRHFRITGIDAPEIGAKARCPAEAAGAIRARDALLTLLNQGPFTLQAPSDGLRDDYGRELITVRRRRDDGTAQDIASDLIAGGTVRRYEYGPRSPWC